MLLKIIRKVFNCQKLILEIQINYQVIDLILKIIIIKTLKIN